jgi:hypothetical protein
MKYLLIGSIVVAIGAVIAIAQVPSEKGDVLNYDELILLDAEDLGEGSLAETYKNDIVPTLRNYVNAPAGIEENLDPKKDLYSIKSQGETYIIYSPDMNITEGQNWGNGTFAIFDIVNRQLKDSPYKFYAINGGNDLGGMFLTKETYENAIHSLERKSDWPYIPTKEHPWYGQPHD